MSVSSQASSCNRAGTAARLTARGLLILLLLSLAAARSEVTSLRGDELLCELSKPAAGEHAPGIYSYRPGEEELHRVAVFGERPRWSPARDSFLFWRDHTLMQWFLASATARTVSVPMLVQSSRVEWWPDASRLVMETPTRAPGDILAGMSLASFVPGQAVGASPLLPHQSQPIVGKWSVSTQGDRIAYEALEFVPGFGPVSASVWIEDIADHRTVPIDPPGVEGCVAYDPQWQPGGDLVAFTLASRDGARSAIGMYDAKSHALRYVGIAGLQDTPTWNEATLQMMSWSPDGRSLAARGRPFAPLSGNAIVYLQDCELLVFTLGERYGVLRPGGPALRPVRAVWSADGRYVAALRSRIEDLPVAPSVRLQVIGPLDAEGPVAWMNVPIPDDLRVVDIDW